jgi:acyl carrier protein
VTSDDPELVRRVIEEVAASLGVDPADVGPDDSLILDLGADSLDLLDLVFRLEEAFGIRIERGQIEVRIKEAMGGDPYELDGVLTPKALALLRRELPEVRPDRFREGLRSSEVVTLFTVRTLVRLVERSRAAPPAGKEPQA